MACKAPVPGRLMFLQRIGLVLLMLSPLIYAFDNDPLRSYEVIAVAACSGALLLACGVRRVRHWDAVLIFLFCILVIVQQLAIDNGSIPFGAQYAVVMAAMFVPAWAMHAAHHGFRSFERAAAWAMNALFVVLVVSIYLSYFFGFGEVFVGEGSTRAFAWLGDSITPVIVFPILFFALQMKWLRVAALLVALYMTGGKAATLMLGAAAVVYALVSPLTPWRRCGSLLLVTVLATATAVYWDALLSEIIPGFAYSYHNRLISFGIGLEYFGDNPWFGVGINQSYKTIEQEAEAAAKAMGIIEFYPVYRIHNAFLRTAAETGIAGLSVFIAFCGVLVARGARAVKSAYHWGSGVERSLVLTGGLWTISFILVYQSTGWFEAGHPQLAWLLMISAVSDVAYRRVTHSHRMTMRQVALTTAAAPLIAHGVYANGVASKLP
jgi:hypothetical protein